MNDTFRHIERVRNLLKGFQSGDFACRENALALTKLQEATVGEGPVA